MSEVECQYCEKVTEDNENLSKRLRVALQELEDLRVLHASVVTKSENLVGRFETLRQSESIHYQALCKAKRKLELIKRANDVEMDLEAAKKVEMKKYDVEEKMIDLEFLKMRGK